MARLIDLRHIREQKIARSRAWIYQRIAAGDFPKPLPLGSSRNLWDEDEVDRWLSDFIAKAKTLGQESAGRKAKRTAMASEARKLGTN